MDSNGRKHSIEENTSSDQRLISDHPNLYANRPPSRTPHSPSGHSQFSSIDPASSTLLYSSTVPSLNASPLKPYYQHQSPPSLSTTFGKINGSVVTTTSNGSVNGGLVHPHPEVVFSAGVEQLPHKPSSTTSSGRITFLEMLRSSKKCLISFIICIILIIALLFTAIVAHNQREICNTNACWEEVRRFESSIDRSVSPCDDFYKFVCGKWINNAQIPDHKPMISHFDSLQDKVKQEVRDIIQAPINKSQDPDFLQKMKHFYHSCLNLTQINQKVDQPLRNLIDELGNWPVLDPEWNEENATIVEIHKRLRKIGLIDDMIVSVSVSADDRNNSKNIISITPPSFGLLDRDFMVRDLYNDSSIQRYYRLMLYTVKLLSDKKFYEQNKKEANFDFFDYDEVELDADIELDQKMKEEMLITLEFEQILANNSMKKEENRNLTLLFNNMTIAGLEEMSPNIPWLDLINVLSRSNLTKSEEVVVIDVNYVKFLDNFLSNTSMRIINNYIIWRIAKTKIGTIDSVYQTLKEQYNSANLGNSKPEPRWTQCVAQVQANLGAALSNVYVRNQLTSGDKEVISKIVLEIKDQFHQTLQKTDWMDRKTRQNAIEKLRVMEFRVGYPDEILIDDLISQYYHELQLDDNYFENILKIGRFSSDNTYHLLREPNSRDDWRKFAEVVEANAFYFHQENTFTLNAGILQGMFFNSNRPDYLNYGAIGEIIGHEITHGYDGYGRQFDKIGQLKNWWNHATARMFERKSSCMVDQYSQYYSKEIDMHVNGVNTQDENIADNGGVSLAYEAYKKARAYHEEALLPVLNFTAQQLFWMSYGIVNCEKVSNEMLKLNFQLDPHTPNHFRLNGVVSNSYDFAKDFKCPLGSPMHPKTKCKVW